MGDYNLNNLKRFVREKRNRKRRQKSTETMDVQTRGKIILGKAVVIENYMDPEMIEFAIQ